MVGAVIVDEARRAFVLRRRDDQPLFGGCWDIVGGHVEPGETAAEALRREIREETGWELRRIARAVTQMCWEVGGRRRHELDYRVEVDGDLDHPRFDAAEHLASRWISVGELDALMEGRGPVNKAVHDIVELALRG